MSTREPWFRARRRTAGLAAIVGAVALMAAACGEGSSGPVTVTYWQLWTDPAQKAGITNAVGLFEKANPDVKVKVVDVNNDDKLIASIAAGKPPDAASLVNVLSMGALASRGAVSNVEDLASRHHIPLHKDDYTRAALDMSTYKGHQYGLTVELDSRSLFVNDDILRAAGITTPPRTMSEVADLAVRLTKTDASGRITQLGIVTGYCGQLVNWTWPYFDARPYDARTSTITAGSPGMVQALKWEKSMIDQIGVQPYLNFTSASAHNPLNNHFYDGNVAMSFDGDWTCASAGKYNPGMHWSVVAPPYADGHPEWEGSTWIDGSVNVIPSAAAHPKEALRFINFMNSTNAQVAIQQTINGQSPLKSASAILAQQRDSCGQLMTGLAAGPRAVAWPVLPVSDEYQSGLLKVEDAVIHGKDTPEHGLADLGSRMQAELKKKR